MDPNTPRIRTMDKPSEIQSVRDIHKYYISEIMMHGLRMLWGNKIKFVTYAESSVWHVINT